MKKYDIAITVGVFDLLHKGHIELFKLMESLADELCVIMHDDISTLKNKGKVPVQRREDRWRNLAEIYRTYENIDITPRPCCSADPSRCIEERILNFKKEREEHNNIYPEKAKGDFKMVYVRGDDWQDFPGKEVIEKHNIPIIYKPYTKGISSTLIREKLKK